MVDEIPVPNGLEQSIGKPKCQDVLCGLLAEEVIDPENLVFAEEAMQFGIEGYCTFQIGAEGLLHDDAGPLSEARLFESADHGQVV